MNCIGIIAEYNPFHNGHAYHIAEAKRISGADFAVVCMSASFVQRGEPACVDKYTRARWAIRNGADMVIELPDVLSVSCAERFAFSGIKLLNATGLVSGICFGSECGDIEMLKHASEAVPDTDILRSHLAEGKPYSAAMSLAAASQGSESLLASPNNLLGIEYLRAIKRINPELNSYTVKRVGSGYNDNSPNTPFASAAAIRASFSVSSGICSSSLPEDVSSEIAQSIASGRFPAASEHLTSAIFYSLRRLGPSGIAQLAEVSEGLENTIFRSACEEKSYRDLIFGIKSKRYTMARIKRILINALLGTTAELQDMALNASDALYIRVLGVRKDSGLLSALGTSAMLPIITRHSDLGGLSENARLVFEHSSLASRIHALANPGDISASDPFSAPLIVL